MTRLFQKIALKIAVRLIVWVGRRMKSQCGQLQLDDARLETQMCLNFYFR